MSPCCLATPPQREEYEEQLRAIQASASPEARGSVDSFKSVSPFPCDHYPLKIIANQRLRVIHRISYALRPPDSQNEVVAEVQSKISIGFDEVLIVRMIRRINDCSNALSASKHHKPIQIDNWPTFQIPVYFDS